MRFALVRRACGVIARRLLHCVLGVEERLRLNNFKCITTYTLAHIHVPFRMEHSQSWAVLQVMWKAERVYGILHT